MSFLLAFTIAAVVALALTPVVARTGTRLGVLDAPGPRKAHRLPVPRVGGVAIAAAAAAGAASVWALSALGTLQGPGLGGLWPILVGAGLAFLVGLVDDVRPLPPLAKLAGQSLAAAVPLLAGIRIEQVTLAGTTYPLGELAPLATLLWIVGITNAFNLIDGLDGLAGGIAVIAAGTCATILIRRGHDAEALLLCALLGASVGFLRYNVPPARVFLGDCGSLLVGFVLAATAITGWQKGATALSVAAPLLMFALPILDTLASIVRRGSSVGGEHHALNPLRLLDADQEHIHHRLVAGGLSARTAVLLLYAVAVVFSLLALRSAADVP